MIKAVEFQAGDTKYEVSYTFDAGENYSLVLGEDETRFSFKYIDGKLSHSVMPQGYSIPLMNDIIHRIYEKEKALTDYVDGLLFFCYIRRKE